MSETATISGTISLNVASGGPSASVVIGSPTITPSSTTGATLSFEESAVNNYVVKQVDGVVVIPFGTVADADILYVGVSQPATVVVDANSFSLAAGGFIFMYMASNAALTIAAATSNDVQVTVAIVGE